jgi:hypothetical protein
MSIEQQVNAAMDAQRRLTPVDLSALADCTVDPTNYAIESILPRGHVTLLGSHGGAGKSVFAEALAAHVGVGAAWAGLPASQGRVVFVSLEDPGDLARFRLRRVCDAYGLPISAVARHVLLLDGSNTDSVLAIEMASAGTRSMAFTETMSEIEIAAEGSRLVIIDNASDAFAGNENERQLVRAFIRRLAHIARKHDCAVLLLAHIDKAAARHGSSGNSYSGSTAWHNTVRSRLALIEDEQGLCLVQEKLNLGKKIDPIRLEWTDTGVLVPLVGAGAGATERDTQDDADLLGALAAAIADGATVHCARSGAHTTKSVLDTFPDLPKALRKDKSRFWAALSRLERVQMISKEAYKDASRHERVRYVVACVQPHTPVHCTHAQSARAASMPRASIERALNAECTQGTQCTESEVDDDPSF